MVSKPDLDARIPRISWTVLLLLAVWQPVRSQTDTCLNWLIRNELNNRPGYKMLQREEHDVNRDGLRETLISLEDTTGESSADSIFFFILQPEAGLGWRVLLRNTGLVQCHTCGGVAGGRGEFSVDTVGAIRFVAARGSRERGERATTIRYNNGLTRWEVARLELGWFDTFDPGQLSPGSSGAWSFPADEFLRPIIVAEPMPAPDELIEDSLEVDKAFVINAPKVFFRSSENVNEPTAAYLLAGDFVGCAYELTNYYGCTYTVGNREVAGFLPKNKLRRVPVKPVGNSLSRVLTARAYLYSSPESRFKTKIYLIKGDTLECRYTVKDYVNCAYTKMDREEKVDVTYYGFFRTADVKSLRTD